MISVVLCLVVVAILNTGLTVAIPVKAAGSAASDRVSAVFKNQTLACDVCKGVAIMLQKLLVTDVAEQAIANIAIFICITFEIQDENVCESIVLLYVDEVLTIFAEVMLDPSQMCGILIGDECGDPYNPFNQSWSVALTSVPKPPVTLLIPPAENAPKNRIVHLSDVHFDKDYTPGLSNDCGEPLCCRIPNEKGVGETAAGFWGDYNCDVPLWTIENLLQTLVQRSDEFDWIYWTGDIPAHNIWNQSRADQIYCLETISDLIRKYLPDKPVFPSIGNHESSPCNSFPPPYITGPDSNEWLLNATADAWSYWLPSPALTTLREGGYYSVEIRKGLRVISLQTNFCNKLNWWLLINSTDPANQLQWLVNQLQASENASEKVHIIGHIPPGHPACLETWSYNFHKIVNRYESTITGQFYGHSHLDEFQIFYDENNTSRPVSFAMLGPSVTPYIDNNMGYCVYTIDGDYAETTNALLDFEVYYMNVSDSRVTNESNWILEYTASNDYGMKHCFPSDFDNLVKRFEQNDALFQKYYSYLTRLNPAQTYCDSDCKEDVICDMKTSRSNDQSLCTCS